MLFTPAADHDESLLSLLMQRWRAWKTSRDSLAGLDSCGRAEVARIAHDLSLTTSELRALARRGPDAANLLYRRMANLGIDRDALARSEPKVLRDMQKDCSLCDSKGRCRHDLARGADASAWYPYCGNDHALSALVAGGTYRAQAVAQAATLAEGRRHGMPAFLLALIFIAFAWVVLLAGHHPGVRRHSTPVTAPATTQVPRLSAATCLDASCLKPQQLSALQGLRDIQAQGWISSSAQQLATVREASLIAQDVHAGEALACVRQGGTTYYGLMFEAGCSKGGSEAARLEGFNECRSMAGGGACLLR